MKTAQKILLVVCVGLLAGCHTLVPQRHIPPSVEKVQKKIDAANASIAEATAQLAGQGLNLDVVYAQLKRADDKSVILLENLR